MSLSKKIRFDVFKRDSFQCGYCGKTPPGVVLEVDHIHPKSKGGKNDMDNLLTACFDCNRGKRDGLLGDVPSTLTNNLKVLKEKQAQMKEYRKFINKIKKLADKDIQYLSDIYEMYFEGWVFTETFIHVSLRTFLKNLPIHEIEEAMTIAFGKNPHDPEGFIKYFCGVCWRKIRGTTKDGTTWQG